jgi:hypothetical protein
MPFQLHVEVHLNSRYWTGVMFSSKGKEKENISASDTGRGMFSSNYRKRRTFHLHVHDRRTFQLYGTA